MNRRKYLDIIFGAIICLIGIWRFVFYDGGTKTNGQEVNTVNIVESLLCDTAAMKEDFRLETSKDNQLVQQVNQSVEIETEIINEKIVNHYIGNIEGLYLLDYGEEVQQDDWIYVIKEASISKIKSDRWDWVPDFLQYKYDENYNLINEYSYLSVRLEITRVDTVRHDEVYLNSMWLGVFDEQGEYLRGGEVRTSSLNKKVSTTYFRCPLEVGETLNTEIVYMMEDKYLEENNFYIIEINNRGVTPQEPNHISLVKIPLGLGVKDEKKNNNGM